MIGEEVGPGTVSFAVIALIIQGSRARDRRGIKGTGMPQEQVHKVVDLIMNEGFAQEMVVEAIAEPLGTEVVGDAPVSQQRDHGFGAGSSAFEAETQTAEPDSEAVAGEMAEFDFVVVAFDLNNFEAFAPESVEAVEVDAFKREPLTGDGMGVFEAGKTDTVTGNIQMLGEGGDGFAGADTAFFEEDEEVRAAS